ncbi:MAG TPA: hypothetical protein P5530_03600 [Candidatus Diapherotrites archaeon]|nr:hypothetical protein [Candidatus Diapherotrites archaeon]
MNIFTKILFIFLAIIILILGFVVGTFILTIIFVLLVLMTLLFVIIWLFNNLVSLFKSNTAKLIFKSVFSMAATYGIISLLWLFFGKFLLQINKTVAFSVVWVVTVFIFGILWYLLHIKKHTKQHRYLWDDYKSTPDKLNGWDVLLMAVLPSILVYIFNLAHAII